MPWNSAEFQKLRENPENSGNFRIVQLTSTENAEKIWNLAEILKISTFRKNSEIFHRIQIIPHFHLPLAIFEQNSKIFAVYSRKNEDIPLETLIRYSYSNLPKFDLQRLNFLSHSLIEIYSQIFQRGIQADFRIENFRCSADLWLEFDVFGEFLRSSGAGAENAENLSLEEIQWKWIRREISNFEYLEILNRKAGRVRGEVHNHPIFPWVTDFCGNFRALNRTKYRLNKGDDQLKEMFSREPSHHVPELLSDIGYMSYRARIEPKSNLCKYVRRKWVPEEYPSSIQRIYQWTPDECIPEFFEDPGIFKSIHPDMADLKLPDFIETPSDFIKYHREILESEEVSMNLDKWIDLVFGALLADEKSVQALNRHLCYVEKNRRGLRTCGMVQLFERQHPQRNPGRYSSPEEENQRVIETGIFQKSSEIATSPEIDENSLYEIYKSARSRSENKSQKKMMIQIVELIARLTVPPIFGCDSLKNAVKMHAYRIPANYRQFFDLFLNGDQECHVEPEKFAFFARVLLNIPAKIADFHGIFLQFQAYHKLRKCYTEKFSKKSQVALLKEVDFLKKSIRKCHFLEFCVVTAFQNMLEDEEACIQAVHKLMPIITRSLSQEALEDLIRPMIELIQSDTSVKLLDRRFLLSVSICYGSRKFVDLFIPPIIEACASENEDRSIVAKESIVWLAKRYGPIICAKFISSNLLRILASCFSEDLEPSAELREDLKVFSLTLKGDQCSSRIESILLEVVLTWSVTFITVQYLPFCIDLIEQQKMHNKMRFETGILAIFRIVEVSIRGMTDNLLMTYLEEYIIQKILNPILSLILDTSIPFSTNQTRNLIFCKFLQVLFFVSQRIGTENTRIYASQPFKKLFETFSELYETNEELQISEKSAGNNLYQIPIWMVRQIIDKFTDVWSVPFLSQFCPDPAFLIPFVSSNSSQNSSSNLAPPISVANFQPSPSSFSSNLSGGNRLFSLSSSMNSPSNFTPIFGGIETTGGNLSQAWCAKISAAVCGASTDRFDHLTLCTFNGHNSEKIRKLAAISNENSFCSASSDKTVKLWSIKPEKESAVECQSTYRNHSKSVLDVAILADNLIASTDGCLHIWDPFRSSILAQIDWNETENSGMICGLASVDRHNLAVISSLNSTVKIFDTRIAGFCSELKVSPGSGMTRAIAVKENDHKLAVALSNGSLAIVDARNGGKITMLAQIPSTHTTTLNWISSSQLLIGDSDEPGVIVETRPYLKIVRKLADCVLAAEMVEADGKLVTLQANSMLRIYKTHDFSRASVETRLKSEILPGQPTAILPLSLNSAYLIGSSQGCIKMMC